MGISELMKQNTEANKQSNLIKHGRECLLEDNKSVNSIKVSVKLLMLLLFRGCCPIKNKNEIVL